MLLIPRPRRFLDTNAAGGGGQGNNQGGSGGGGNGGQGGGGGDDDDLGGGTTLPERAEMRFQALLLRHNKDAVAVARFLYDEGHTLRGKLRVATDELAGFRTRNPQGSVVLHGETLAEYNALKALGKAADVKAALDEATKTKSDLAAAKTRETRAAAAKALKWNPVLLDDRLTVAGMDVDVRDELDANNQKVPTPYVRKAGDANATWEKLSSVAERDWKDHLIGLRTVAGGDGGAGGAGAGDSPASYVPFPDNGAGGGTTSTGLVDQFIDNTRKAGQKKTNPLRTQGAPAGQS